MRDRVVERDHAADLLVSKHLKRRILGRWAGHLNTQTHRFEVATAHSSLAALRAMTLGGRDLLCEIPAARWDAAQAAADGRLPPNVASRTRHGAFLSGAGCQLTPPGGTWPSMPALPAAATSFISSLK